MSLDWWEWGPVQDRLRRYLRSLVLPAHYELEFGGVPTARVTYQLRLVQVNPVAYGQDRKEQYAATKGLIAHEAGHILFTDTTAEPGDPLARVVFDYLEDGRVEEHITRLLPHTRGPIHKVGRLALRASRVQAIPPFNRRMPGRALLRACLVWRWCVRDGEPLWFPVPEEWERIRPLVEEAWVSTPSRAAEIAEEIAAILRRLEPNLDDLARAGALSGLGLDARPEGENSPDGLPVPQAGGPAKDPSDADGDGGDGEELTKILREAGAGSAGYNVAPYLWLEEKVRPHARRLAELVRVPQRRGRLVATEDRGRYSWRQELRTPDRPFLLWEGPGPKPPRAAIGILVDTSGSMQSRGKIQGAREALMMLHLALREGRVPHAVVAFDDRPRVVKEIDDDREVVKARIAALHPDGNTYVRRAFRRVMDMLRPRPEERKLIIVIHDGKPDDCLPPRPEIPVLGVYVGRDRREKQAMQEIFPRLVAVERAEELHIPLARAIVALLRG